MPPTTWVKIVARNCAPLHWSAEVHQQAEGIILPPLSWHITKNLIIKYRSPLTVDFKPVGAEAQETNFAELIQRENPDVDAVLAEIERIISATLAVHPGIHAADVWELYQKHRYAMGLMIMGYWLFPIAKAALEREMGEAMVQQHEHTLLQPHKTPTLGREHAALLSARARYREGTISEQELQRFAQSLAAEFGFLHSEYVGREWTEADYLEEIRASAPEATVAPADVAAIEHASPYARWLVSVLRRCAYTFDDGKMALVRANWALRKTAKSLGVNDLDLLHCIEDELAAWVKMGTLPPAAVLEERRHFYAARLWNGAMKELSTEAEVRNLIDEEGITEFADVTTLPQELKGQPAYVGKVQGLVHVVYNQDDADHIQEGEILVASMTTPEMIRGLRRAAAFVTDEGGVLCHAAIVAREMGKPCITGASLATKVLKNGDRIEVDAEKGVVRILSKQS